VTPETPNAPLLPAKPILSVTVNGETFIGGKSMKAPLVVKTKKLVETVTTWLPNGKVKQRMSTRTENSNGGLDGLDFNSDTQVPREVTATQVPNHHHRHDEYDGHDDDDRDNDRDDDKHSDLIKAAEKATADEAAAKAEKTAEEQTKAENDAADKKVAADKAAADKAAADKAAADKAAADKAAADKEVSDKTAEVAAGIAAAQAMARRTAATDHAQTLINQVRQDSAADMTDVNALRKRTEDVGALLLEKAKVLDDMEEGPEKDAARSHLIEASKAVSVVKEMLAGIPQIIAREEASIARIQWDMSDGQLHTVTTESFINDTIELEKITKELRHDMKKSVKEADDTITTAHESVHDAVRAAAEDMAAYAANVKALIEQCRHENVVHVAQLHELEERAEKELASLDEKSKYADAMPDGSTKEAIQANMMVARRSITDLKQLVGTANELEAKEMMSIEELRRNVSEDGKVDKKHLVSTTERLMATQAKLKFGFPVVVTKAEDAIAMSHESIRLVEAQERLVNTMTELNAWFDNTAGAVWEEEASPERRQAKEIMFKADASIKNVSTAPNQNDLTERRGIVKEIEAKAQGTLDIAHRSSRSSELIRMWRAGIDKYREAHVRVQFKIHDMPSGLLKDTVVNKMNDVEKAIEVAIAEAESIGRNSTLSQKSAVLEKIKHVQDAEDELLVATDTAEAQNELVRDKMAEQVHTISDPLEKTILENKLAVSDLPASLATTEAKTAVAEAESLLRKLQNASMIEAKLEIEREHIMSQAMRISKLPDGEFKEKQKKQLLMEAKEYETRERHAKAKKEERTLRAAAAARESAHLTEKALDANTDRVTAQVVLSKGSLEQAVAAVDTAREKELTQRLSQKTADAVLHEAVDSNAAFDSVEGHIEKSIHANEEKDYRHGENIDAETLAQERKVKHDETAAANAAIAAQIAIAAADEQKSKAEAEKAANQEQVLKAAKAAADAKVAKIKMAIKAGNDAMEAARAKKAILLAKAANKTLVGSNEYVLLMEANRDEKITESTDAETELHELLMEADRDARIAELRVTDSETQLENATSTASNVAAELKIAAEKAADTFNEAYSTADALGKLRDHQHMLELVEAAQLKEVAKAKAMAEAAEAAKLSAIEEEKKMRDAASESTVKLASETKDMADKMELTYRETEKTYQEAMTADTTASTAAQNAPLETEKARAALAASEEALSRASAELFPYTEVEQMATKAIASASVAAAALQIANDKTTNAKLISNKAAAAKTDADAAKLKFETTQKESDEAAAAFSASEDQRKKMLAKHAEAVSQAEAAELVARSSLAEAEQLVAQADEARHQALHLKADLESKKNERDAAQNEVLKAEAKAQQSQKEATEASQKQEVTDAEAEAAANKALEQNTDQADQDNEKAVAANQMALDVSGKAAAQAAVDKHAFENATQIRNSIQTKFELADEAAGTAESNALIDTKHAASVMAAAQAQLAAADRLKLDADAANAEVHSAKVEEIANPRQTQAEWEKQVNATKEDANAHEQAFAVLKDNADAAQKEAEEAEATRVKEAGLAESDAKASAKAASDFDRATAAKASAEKEQEDAKKHLDEAIAFEALQTTHAKDASLHLLEAKSAMDSALAQKTSADKDAARSAKLLGAIQGFSQTERNAVAMRTAAVNAAFLQHSSELAMKEAMQSAEVAKITVDKDTEDASAAAGRAKADGEIARASIETEAAAEERRKKASVVVDRDTMIANSTAQDVKTYTEDLEAARIAVESHQETMTQLESDKAAAEEMSKQDGLAEEAAVASETKATAVDQDEKSEESSHALAELTKRRTEATATYDASRIKLMQATEAEAAGLRMIQDAKDSETSINVKLQTARALHQKAIAALDVALVDQLNAVADAAEARKQMRKDKESAKKSQDEADVATVRLTASTTAAALAAKKAAESEALAKKVVGEKEEADRADKTAQDAAQSAREALKQSSEQAAARKAFLMKIAVDAKAAADKATAEANAAVAKVTHEKAEAAYTAEVAARHVEEMKAEKERTEKEMAAEKVEADRKEIEAFEQDLPEFKARLLDQRQELDEYRDSETKSVAVENLKRLMYALDGARAHVSEITRLKGEQEFLARKVIGADEVPEGEEREEKKKAEVEQQLQSLHELQVRAKEASLSAIEKVDSALRISDKSIKAAKIYEETSQILLAAQVMAVKVSTVEWKQVSPRSELDAMKDASTDNMEAMNELESARNKLPDPTTLDKEASRVKSMLVDSISRIDAAFSSVVKAEGLMNKVNELIATQAPEKFLNYAAHKEETNIALDNVDEKFGRMKAILLEKSELDSSIPVQEEIVATKVSITEAMDSVTDAGNGLKEVRAELAAIAVSLFTPENAEAKLEGFLKKAKEAREKANAAAPEVHELQEATYNIPNVEEIKYEGEEGPEGPLMSFAVEP